MYHISLDKKVWVLISFPVSKTQHLNEGGFYSRPFNFICHFYLRHQFIIDLNSLSGASSYQKWFWVNTQASKWDQAFIFYNVQTPRLIIKTGIYSEQAYSRKYDMHVITKCSNHNWNACTTIPSFTNEHSRHNHTSKTNGLCACIEDSKFYFPFT